MARGQGRRCRRSWSWLIAAGFCGVWIAAVGCSSLEANPTGQGAGSGGTTGVVGVTPQSLLPDPYGWVDRGSTGSTNIQGQWYAYADGIGRDGSTQSGACERAGHPVGDCSQVASPQPGSFPNSAGKMCTMGIAARILPDPDGSAAPNVASISGAGIALDFNDAVEVMPEAMPYDAPANRVQGIGFDIDVVPPSGLQVGFPTPATTADPAFWGGLQMVSPVVAGHNEVRWSSVAGPHDLSNAPAFDPTVILGIRFHVPSNATSAGSYNFCVSNLLVRFR